ncbi:MAG: hypothetical protein H0T17_04180 [Propionibacteriales bacterium]|nr:hypothetical protein [Propionibacteriales bacterium]
MPVLLAVVGAAPAVGKSTLTRALRDWLRDRGHDVDHVEEDEILTRPAFAPLARELAVRESVALETLVVTVTDVVTAAGDDEQAVLLFDSLFPFVSSLAQWGYGKHRIAGFFDEIVARLGDTRIIVVYLDADIDQALRNAELREPPGWLEWYLDDLAHSSPATGTPRELAVDRLAQDRELTLQLVDERRWILLRVPNCDLLSVDQVFARACDELETVLAQA